MRGAGDDGAGGAATLVAADGEAEIDGDAA
jgi:hypothetical protein